MKLTHSGIMILLILICVYTGNAQESEQNQNDYIVKLFYFIPNDRKPQLDINSKIDTIIRKVQNFYANEMEKQGFGRKTFRYEMDENGNAEVHHVVGKNGDEHYRNNPARSFREIPKSLYKYNKTVQVIYVDISKKILPGGAAGLAYSGKRILIPATGGAFNVGVTAHELGHAFGLPHGVGGLRGFSIGATAWLDVNRYFNPDLLPLPKDNEAKVNMLPFSIAYPPHNPQIFFEITDTDGLQIVRFMHGPTVLHSAEIVSGVRDIAKFITFGETPKNNRLKVVTADVKGGGTFGKWLTLEGVEPNMVLDISVDRQTPAGLIGYWTLDEVKGPYVFNSVENKHHVKLKEGVIPLPNSGKIGGALTTKWKHGATVENAAELINGLDAFTVAIWVKSDTIGTDRGFISTKSPSRRQEQQFSIRYDAKGTKGGGINVIKATINTTGGLQTYESASNIQTTEWQHITLTWQSGSPLKLYVNGKLDKPTNNSIGKQGTLKGADRFVIGKGSLDNHIAWRGLIDDVRLYNRVLNEQEINELPHVTKSNQRMYGVSLAAVADINDDVIEKQGDVNYIISVTNTGNTRDMIRLNTTGNNEAKVSQNTVELQPAASSEVRLIVPRNTGKNAVKVVATSENDMSKTAQVTTTTIIR